MSGGSAEGLPEQGEGQDILQVAQQSFGSAGLCRRVAFVMRLGAELFLGEEGAVGPGPIIAKERDYRRQWKKLFFFLSLKS